VRRKRRKEKEKNRKREEGKKKRKGEKRRVEREGENLLKSWNARCGQGLEPLRTDKASHY
jgi:hypothetical protein